MLVHSVSAFLPSLMILGLGSQGAHYPFCSEECILYRIWDPSIIQGNRPIERDWAGWFWVQGSGFRVWGFFLAQFWALDFRFECSQMLSTVFRWAMIFLGLFIVAGGILLGGLLHGFTVPLHDLEAKYIQVQQHVSFWKQ